MTFNAHKMIRFVESGDHQSEVRLSFLDSSRYWFYTWFRGTGRNRFVSFDFETLLKRTITECGLIIP